MLSLDLRNILKKIYNVIIKDKALISHWSSHSFGLFLSFFGGNTSFLSHSSSPQKEQLVFYVPVLAGKFPLDCQEQRATQVN